MIDCFALKQTARIFVIAVALLRLPEAFSSTQNKVCMVLDRGGENDDSFNQLSVEAFKKAKQELKIDPQSKYVEPKSDIQIPQFFRNFANQSDCGLIIAVGFNNVEFLKNFAPQYPNRKFLAIDASVSSEKNNVRSITFSEHEGSFLVGAAAAMISNTGKIGFIGGMDIPLIHRFFLGYASGAKYINSKIEVLESYIGITPEAWANPAKAKELALSQYKNGADIIYHASAASGSGIYDAAEQLNKDKKIKKYFAIGVDSNQNGLKPGTILTSMVKRIDTAIYTSIKEFVENKFTAGTIVFGLHNSGVDWALDKHNQHLFTKDQINKINKIKSEIISGKIVVPDYYKQNANGK
ncbi:MAG: BMP family ABC transporter substrate-binding protein [Silvanigrellaceae bacterium]|nr:BMP family ABC transporter substrate-binding protein [Silvanigrellaceae bacterium]